MGRKFDIASGCECIFVWNYNFKQHPFDVAIGNKHICTELIQNIFQKGQILNLKFESVTFCVNCNPQRSHCTNLSK